MKKLKINKVIILTLCFILTSSTLVLAKPIKNTNRISKACVQYIDPFPEEDTGWK